MPKAPASEVHLDLSVVAIAGVSEGARTREERRRGHGEERVAAEVAARLDRRRLVAVGAVLAHANGCGSERPALDAEGRGAACQDQTEDEVKRTRRYHRGFIFCTSHYFEGIHR